MLQTAPLLQSVGNQDNNTEALPDLLRFVLFLYMIRCPHSRQRMGSRGLMSFLAPQSSVHHYQHRILFATSYFSPAHKYSISCLGGGKSCAVAAEWGCPCWFIVVLTKAGCDSYSCPCDSVWSPAPEPETGADRPTNNLHESKRRLPYSPHRVHSFLVVATDSLNDKRLCR